MTRAAVYTLAAEADLADAVEWYRRRDEALAERLLAETAAVAKRLEDNPFQFPIVHRDVRRVLLRRFPYALFFRIIGEKVQVLACFHTRRNPRVWRRRA